MVLQMLIVLELAIIVGLLWKLVKTDGRTAQNVAEETATLLSELQNIRAGLFAITRIEKTEGWPEFDKLSKHIVEDYIAPETLDRILSTGQR